VPIAHCSGALEEAFAGHGEELGAIARSVAIQQGRFALLGFTP